MVAGRPLLVFLLLVAGGLTGCLGGDDTNAGSITPLGNESGLTDVPPDGRDGKIVAFEETNATESGVGGLDHHHDMWGSETRLVMFETPAAMEPYPDDQNRAYVDFQPPQGKLVYEATGTVEFTISNPQRRACPYGGTFDGEYPCTDNAGRIAGSFTGVPMPADGAPRAPDPTGGPSGLNLRYKHAATINWIDAGDLVWGTPLVIKITDPRQTDMPHATSSLWEFEVVSPNAQDVTLTFDAKAELVKGEVGIPLWPGHPDFYAERPTREVLNTLAVACDQSGCSGADEEGPVYAQKLISYGTKSLHVWVNITEKSFPNPATTPNNWFLYHINATGRDNLTDPFDPEATIDKTSFYWIFPVDDNGMDSPYADGSRWNFMLGASLTTPLLSCYSNCADWGAKYTIVAHATNEVLPFEQYTYKCLRDEECPAPEGGSA